MPLLLSVFVMALCGVVIWGTAAIAIKIIFPGYLEPAMNLLALAVLWVCIWKFVIEKYVDETSGNPDKALLIWIIGYFGTAILTGDAIKLFIP